LRFFKALFQNCKNIIPYFRNGAQFGFVPLSIISDECPAFSLRAVPSPPMSFMEGMGFSVHVIYGAGISRIIFGGVAFHGEIIA